VVSALSRKGVALLQFGGPDSPEAIRPFLKDLFDDPEILAFPAIVRKPLAWTIAKFRAPIVAKNYAQMGGASPIGKWTALQADAIRRALPDVPVEVAMRSWGGGAPAARARGRGAAPRPRTPSRGCWPPGATRSSRCPSTRSTRSPRRARR
jgi:ferrochelatase